MSSLPVSSSTDVKSNYKPEFPATPFEDAALFISHELRTPLTSIQGVLGLLDTGQLGSLSEEGQRLLAIAISNAHRLTRLANAIDHDSAGPVRLFSTTEIEQLQLENSLHRALERQEFHLAYQPIVAVRPDRVIGFEALVRWHHPSRGLISPSVFIPIAEQAGIIHRLGMWVLERACHDLHRWQQQLSLSQPLSVSVNLSVLQLFQPNLIQDVKRVLQESQIAPHSLKLEITETALMENYELATSILAELKAMGVQLYIDDFGTGYSSLSRLQDLPIDAVKIDRSFVQHQRWDISEAIIALAAKLGLMVIAEGVETLEELEMLKHLGCNQIQGYFFSRPLDQESAIPLVKSYLDAK